MPNAISLTNPAFPLLVLVFFLTFHYLSCVRNCDDQSEFDIILRSSNIRTVIYSFVVLAVLFI